MSRVPVIPPTLKRQLSYVLAGWLVLTAVSFGLGWQNLSAPGLFYDEAVYGGLAKDFLAGQAGRHMPGASSVSVLGGPFPLFVQPYLGALKCWLLIPIFKCFGATVAVMRGANLVFSSLALLLFMLWTWRLLGVAEALAGALLLALDPAFFFLGVLDWGSLLPSLLCRMGGFLLFLTAWRRQRAGWALAAGLVCGLGFFNKIDFGVILAGSALSVGCVDAKALIASARAKPKIMLSAILGGIVGAGLMVAMFHVVLHAVFSRTGPPDPGEHREKWNAFCAMYDGSYFYRLMDVGGVFDRMYVAPSPVWTPLGVAVLVAALLVLARIIFVRQDNSRRTAEGFVLLAAAFITAGAFILPGAVRIHHTTMVYPFPHLLIALASVAAWRHGMKAGAAKPMVCALAILFVGGVAVGNLHAILRTEKLIHDTGGRGWWSNRLMDFANQYQRRSDLTISSLDWGFSEQLEFLTTGPQLDEPFWELAHGLQPSLPRDPNHVYLLHAPGLELSPFGAQFLEAVRRENTNAIITPWEDKEGQTVFYSVSFSKP